MHADGYHHDGEYAEVEDGVDEDGEGAGAHVAELHNPDPRRQLEQEPRRQQDEQHHRHDDRPPVRRHHLSLSLSHRLARSHLRCVTILCSRRFGESIRGPVNTMLWEQGSQRRWRQIKDEGQQRERDEERQRGLYLLDRSAASGRRPVAKEEIV